MSPKQIINWVELNFWNTAIPLLKRSPAVGKAVNWGYTALQGYQLMPLHLKALFLGGLGLVSGLLLGTLGAALF
ncbi:MAG: hypothetical protein OEZ02_02845 [Anaerolineae bacterium]|nr:hypothetical protein [Anaerolineae bacterium]